MRFWKSFEVKKFAKIRTDEGMGVGVVGARRANIVVGPRERVEDFIGVMCRSCRDQISFEIEDLGDGAAQMVCGTGDNYPPLGLCMVPGMMQSKIARSIEDERMDHEEEPGWDSTSNYKVIGLRGNAKQR